MDLKKLFLPFCLAFSFCLPLAQAYLPPQFSTQEAMQKARVSLAMKSVEGTLYDLYLISDDEQYLGGHYFWAKDPYESNYQGHYTAYLAPSGNNVPAQQQAVDFSTQRRNGTRSTLVISGSGGNRNGFYVAPGKAGMPDILILTQRMTGGGSFLTTAYLIKEGSLQPLRYMNKNRYITKGHSAGFKKLHYLDDGTFAVPWWSNARPGGGRFITVYMLDVKDRLLVEAYRMNDEEE